MNDLLTISIEFFRQYNMLFLACLILLQGIGIPTGAGALVIAAGAFAFAGDYNIYLLFFEVWVFSSLGDCIGYYVWNKFSVFLFNKIPKLKHYLQPKLIKSDIFLKKHGGLAILLTRFPISALGAFVNATAGITNYGFFKFILIAIAGESFWVAFYLAIGYWFGDAWETINDFIMQFGILILLVVLLIILMYVAYKNLVAKDPKKNNNAENQRDGLE
jgi:membrane-associated protein